MVREILTRQSHDFLSILCIYNAANNIASIKQYIVSGENNNKTKFKLALKIIENVYFSEIFKIAVVLSDEYF